MKQLTTKGIILNRLNFSEADRIVAVLTPDHGKVSMIAKGARRQKSKLAGGIELLCINDITFVAGKSEIKTITSARIHTHFKKIITDIDRTMMAYDFLKMIDIVTTHQNDNLYYELLSIGLQHLDESVIDPQIVYCWFVSNLMQQEGNHINLERPLNAEEFSEDEQYNFNYDDMVFSRSDNGTYTPEHIKLLRLSVASSPEVLAAVENAEQIFADIADLLKNVSRYTILND